MFQPRYLKQAKLLHKGVTRFLHYKRDLIPAPKLDEIEGQQKRLKEAIKEKDAKKIEDLTKEINKTCEKALPEMRNSELAENIEVFFVSIVIALGIRTYIAQPFQIPTGSMQPTLSGIVVEATQEDPTPGFLGRVAGWVTGVTYINAVSDHDGELDHVASITEKARFRIFRSYSILHFTDGHTISINCPMNQLISNLGLDRNLGVGVDDHGRENPDLTREVVLRVPPGTRVHKGQLLARGVVRSGDHVIVNKFAYHFRRPERGEVFVFTTKNITGIESESRFNPNWGSQHYIKRLAGVPGDDIKIDPPELFINGKAATERGIRRVVDQKEPGYRGYSPSGTLERTLKTYPQDEYMALGDNSYFSSDSRFWGPVPRQNLVGPGWFCYWPLREHWGPIK